MSERYGSESPRSTSETIVREAFRRATGRGPDPEPEAVSWLSSAMAGRTGRIRAGGKSFFVKWSADPAGMAALNAEADGLRRLNEVNSGTVVDVVGNSHAGTGDGAILVLEYINRGSPAADYDDRLARALAGIHEASADSFGLDLDNFIGSTPQINEYRPTWPEFFAQQRLGAMAERLRTRGAWPKHWSRPFENLVKRLPELLPERPLASLVHGDLWSGNVMTAADGSPVLIDPAVYYGHAETDLAMMRLFGGFGSRVFERYAGIRGRESGAADRVSVYNLYHLLNHVLLFGAGYHGGVERTLGRFE